LQKKGVILPTCHHKRTWNAQARITSWGVLEVKHSEGKTYSGDFNARKKRFDKRKEYTIETCTLEDKKWVIQGKGVVKKRWGEGENSSVGHSIKRSMERQKEKVTGAPQRRVRKKSAVLISDWERKAVKKVKISRSEVHW